MQVIMKTLAAQTRSFRAGIAENADLNAAKNILNKGLTGGLPGMACGSNLVKGRKQERRVAKRGSSALKGRE